MAENKQKAAMEKQLTKIVKKDGHVAPSKLVEVSRPENSITHDCFLWDDLKAGEEYRLIQARQWIRAVKIEVLDKEDQKIKVNFAHVPVFQGKGEGVYKLINVIVESPTDFERALNAAITDLESAERRVSELKEAAEGIGAADKVPVIAELALTLSTMRGVLERLH